MTKRMIWVIAGLVILFGGIFGWKAFRSMMVADYLANMKPPAMTVSSTRADLEPWVTKINAIGELAALQGIEITPEVPGKVTSINFDSGQRVEEGTVLVQLDASAEKANLLSLKAELELARLDHERALGLVKKAAVSQAQLDRATSKMDSLKARVEEQQALIEKKTLRAPFAGELGIRQVDLGEFVSPGTKIVTLQQLSPLYANFTLPERYLNHTLMDREIEVQVAAFPGETFPGRVNAVSPRVEQVTRTMQVQATVANEDRRLRPGMFARVAILMGAQTDVITLPRTAVTFLPYGDSVFLILGQGEDLTVEAQPVRTGRIRGETVEILSGLEPGQLVVNTGQNKLRNGTRVRIDNSVVLSGNVTKP